MLKALSDSSRLMIINSLLLKSQYVEELSKRLNLAPSTISFHLKKLESAGLVFKTKEQYYAIYHVNHELFGSKLKDLISFDNLEKRVQDERIKNFENKILKIYFKNGRLIKIPTQYKKRVVILEEIAKNFVKDKQYSEFELNSILINVYDDYVSIRRYLIDEKIFKRKNGIYELFKDFTGEEPVIKFKTKLLTSDKEKNILDKNELKQAYKLTPIPMGIYQIRNLKNGHIFIGGSPNLQAKITRHKAELRSGGNRNIELQKEWSEYGESGFVFEILDYLKPNDEPDFNYDKELEVLKELWFNKFKSENKSVFKILYR
jgi:biotin operon repressor